MTDPNLEQHALDSRSLDLRGAARALGTTVLGLRTPILNLLADPECAAQVHRVVAAAAGTEEAARAVATGELTVAAYFDALDAPFRWLAEDVLHPLATLKVLCVGPLKAWYEGVDGVVDLRYGDPYPLPAPRFGRNRPPLTLSLATRQAAGIMAATGFDLYARGDDDPLRFVLDYGLQGQLDPVVLDVPVANRPAEDEEELAAAPPGEEVSWGPGPMATLHPLPEPGSIAFEEPDETTFFAVRPVGVDADAVLRNLHAVARAEPTPGVAVVPELVLERADALEEGLRSGHADLPDLIAAGSAHETDADGVRRNVGRLYFQGRCVLEYEKLRPMELDGRREGIDPRYPRTYALLSDADTRVAVVICADLFDRELMTMLRDAGVTLLLVPSMTPGLGSFAEATTAIAANQGFTVISNVLPDRKRGQQPFLVHLGTPVQGRESEAHPDGLAAPWQRRASVTAWRAAKDDRVTFDDWA